MDTVSEQAPGTQTHGGEGALALLMREVLDITIEPDYAIESEIEANRAADSLRRVNGLLKRVESQRGDELRGPLATVSAIRERYRPPETLLEQAKATLRAAIGSWTDRVLAEQERKRLQVEMTLAAERARVAAESAREVETARARAESLRNQAETAAADGRAAQAAALTERAGGFEAQAQLVEQSAGDRIAEVELSVAAPEPEPAFDGVSSSVAYVGEVRDLRQFMLSCANDPDLDVATLFEVRAASLRALAKTFRMGLAKRYPGALAKPQRVVSARSK
jgi:hypothetical protein